MRDDPLYNLGHFALDALLDGDEAKARRTARSLTRTELTTVEQVATLLAVVARTTRIATWPATDADHSYLSTACLHGHHDHCGTAQHARGDLGDPHCKFCPSSCTCPCHHAPEETP